MDSGGSRWLYKFPVGTIIGKAAPIYIRIASLTDQNLQAFIILKIANNNTVESLFDRPPPAPPDTGRPSSYQLVH